MKNKRKFDRKKGPTVDEENLGLRQAARNFLTNSGAPCGDADLHTTYNFPHNHFWCSRRIARTQRRQNAVVLDLLMTKFSIGFELDISYFDRGTIAEDPDIRT